jgi:3',5'-cyclic AMP phosphodiesterase CpdA
MKLRNFSGLFLFLAGVVAFHACGGGTTDGPTPVPTPAPTPNFPVIVAAGDISCDSATPQLPCKSKETSDLIMSERALHPAVVVLPLGDLQYDSGTLSEFRKNYHATWGRVNEYSHPVTGNHEYETRGAAGYFDYFASVGVAVGARNEGWYSYSVGDWRFVALNSNCGSVGGCNAGSAQYRWLQSELLQNKQKCTVAYMHHPFLSSGQNGSTPALLPLMRLLYENNVDLVLAGHDHLYERFHPITPEQVADPAKGLRLFTVGTGGRDLYTFPRVLPNSAVRDNQNFGLLRITMKEAAYDWSFVNISGIVIDSGSGVCF